MLWNSLFKIYYANSKNCYLSLSSLSSQVLLIQVNRYTMHWKGSMHLPQNCFSHVFAAFSLSTKCKTSSGHSAELCTAVKWTDVVLSGFPMRWTCICTRTRPSKGQLTKQLSERRPNHNYCSADFVSSLCSLHQLDAKSKRCSAGQGTH